MADPYTSAGGSPPHAMACPGPGEAGPRRSTTSAPRHRSVNGPFQSAPPQVTALPRSAGSATPPAAWPPAAWPPAAPVTPTNATPASTPVPSGAAPWGAPTVPGR